MKNFFLKKLTLPCVALMLVLCMMLSGCSGRRSVSAEEFTAAIESAGFTLEDIAPNYDPSVVKTALFYSDDYYLFGYYDFTNASDAKSNYAQYYSSLYTETANEKHIDSTEYNRYLASTEDTYVLLYRNGTNMICILGPEPEQLSAIAETLGI